MKRALKITRKKKFFFRFFSKCRGKFRKNWKNFGSLRSRARLRSLYGFWFTLFPIQLIRRSNSKKVKKKFFLQNFGPNRLSEFGPNFWEKFIFLFFASYHLDLKERPKKHTQTDFQPSRVARELTVAIFPKKNPANPSTKIAL